MLAELGSRLLPTQDALSRHERADAVVAVVLRERDGMDVLLMRRTQRVSDPWSGHWSLPGGRRHPGEPLVEAVRRETREEVGLQLQESELLGCLPARAPGNRPKLLVLPFVFAWDRPDEPQVGPEAAAVEWVRLSELLRTRSTVTKIIANRPLPAFLSGDRMIWGFTYRLLEDLLQLLPQ